MVVEEITLNDGHRNLSDTRQPVKWRRRLLWGIAVGMSAFVGFSWQFREPTTDEIVKEVLAIGGDVQAEPVCSQWIQNHLPESWALVIVSHLPAWADEWQTVCSISQTGRATEADFQKWGKLRRLQELDLSHSQITDAGLANFRRLKNLKVLNLSHTMISDEGLVHLRGMASLQELDLYHTQVCQFK